MPDSFGMQLPINGPQHKIFDQVINKVLNFTLFQIIMGFEVGICSFSPDQAATGYE